LGILKEDYAKMIVKSYKSRSEQSRAMFILSSENFLQAYKRGAEAILVLEKIKEKK
jgi:hypothetical protein